MNYYEILGVSAEATEQQIKEGYRREAMKWHPDRHEGTAAKSNADRRFKDLALAYRTLRDPSARTEYDRQLKFKLNQEFETRQREQARQRQEQERQQAHSEQAKDDFADTRPPFEEEAMSGADADQMFREQMLDLATELAARGFPEFNIYKALVALGCPEVTAKQAALLAGKTQSGASKERTSCKNTETSRFDKTPKFFAIHLKSLGIIRSNVWATLVYCSPLILGSFFWGAFIGNRVANPIESIILGAMFCTIAAIATVYIIRNELLPGYSQSIFDLLQDKAYLISGLYWLSGFAIVNLFELINQYAPIAGYVEFYGPAISIIVSIFWMRYFSFLLRTSIFKTANLKLVTNDMAGLQWKFFLNSLLVNCYFLVFIIFIVWLVSISPTYAVKGYFVFLNWFVGIAIAMSVSSVAIAIAKLREHSK